VDVSYALNERTIVWPTAKPFVLFGRAVTVDVSRAALADADYLITRADLARHERRVGRIARSSIVRRRGVSAVGIDTASIDRGQSKLFKSHQVLGAAGVPVFENVANLQKLPRRAILVVALPMKIDGGSGGPLRAIAIVP
jgi:kynurenine formamidase